MNIHIRCKHNNVWIQLQLNLIHLFKSTPLSSSCVLLANVVEENIISNQ